MEKRKFLPLPGLELRPHGVPARSQSLYRLSSVGRRGCKAIQVPAVTVQPGRDPYRCVDLYFSLTGADGSQIN
jgi:hypothetical protein